MFGRAALFVSLVGVVVCVVGCEPPEGWPLPPFDTTGTYEGTWQGQSTGEGAPTQEVLACPLTVTLSQDLTANYPADHLVEGTVVVDYSCIELPEWVDDIPASEVQVGGVLADDGTLTLISGGCGTGLCVVLVLTGEGEDTDADGVMDTYSGQWAYTILLAGVEPFGFAGTYTVSRE